MPVNPQPDVVVRPATSQDVSICGDICYRAFASINAAHNFPCDFPNPEAATRRDQCDVHCARLLLRRRRKQGRILGSNCLDERSIIHGIGPITVDPDTQNHGVGRKLMDAVLERVPAAGAAGIRLVQAAFHNRSLSLYASLGFDIREPLAVMQGRTRERSALPAAPFALPPVADLPACNALSHRVHGFDRGTRTRRGHPARLGDLVTERGGRITAYASHLAFFGHATAESNADLQALHCVGRFLCRTRHPRPLS